MSQSDNPCRELSDSVSDMGMRAHRRPTTPMITSRTTGQAARLIHSTEPRLADLVRKGKIQPEPLIVAGRRQWAPIHILQAARHLGIPTDDLRRRLDGESSDPSADVLAPVAQEVGRG